MEIRQDVAGTQDVYVFLERAGNRSLDSFYQIDLNASWQFPISGRFEGSLRLEVINVLNDQTQLTVNATSMLAGDPPIGATSANYQAPRSVQAFASLRF
jgi:outer membrane receptor protein involved in Fe transport